MIGTVFDLSKPFGYFEAFSTIGIVLALSLVCFLILRHFKPQN